MSSGRTFAWVFAIPFLAGLAFLTLSPTSAGPSDGAPSLSKGAGWLAATPIVSEFAVVTDTAIQWGPAISGNIVVWTDNRNSPTAVCVPDTAAGNCDIYGKDLATGREFPVVTHTARQLLPAISGQIVVWEDWRNLGTSNADICGARLEWPSTGAVEGYVRSSTNNSPIAGATVQLAGTTRTVTTNASGFYRMTNVPAGSRQFTASKSGYTPQTKAVTVSPGGTATLNLSLTPR